MTRLDLTDDQRDVLARTLRDLIAADRFPLSPRVRCLRQIVEKLEPPSPAAEPFPAPKPPAEPTHARRRR